MRVADRPPQPELPIHIDALGGAVVVTDPEMRILRWNRGAEQLYGYRADEVAGRDALELLLSPQSGIPFVQMSERLARGVSWSGILTLQRRDGSEFTARVTDSPIRDPDGTLIAVICVAYDAHAPEQVQPNGVVPAATSQGLVLRRHAREAFAGETQLDLSPTEFDLLDLFLSNIGRVLTHDQIARAVWGYGTNGSTNFVQAAVSRLRRKLSSAGSPDLLETVRGRGYILRSA